MPKQPLSLAMSQIIAHDAPLLSPTDSTWEPLFSPSHDNFTYAYYNIPPSPTAAHPPPADPIAAASMLKSRVPAQDLCVPTHQLFDFPEANPPPTPPTRSSSLLADPDATSSITTDDPCFSRNKRSASPAPSATKKRAVGERISSKDFVPPDVSGLSKREARLVKNRAAAFLSRQRKREEFECMEVRVAELEQENARLLALTQSASPSSQPPSDNILVSEVEQLKAQLAAARERELSLSAQLANTNSVVLPSVKVEASDHNPLHTLPAASPRSSVSNSVPSPHKSGASFGLMVLLCALPSLLSMRMQSTAPTSFSIPNPFPSSSSSYDYNSFLPSEYDWAKATGPGSSMMDLDADHHSLEYPAHHSHHHHNNKPARKQLEFTSEDDASELGGLGDLDISFDTSPTDDGKIRVRIHPSSSSSSASSSSSRSGSPGLSSSSSQHDISAPVTPSSPSSSSSLAMWSGASVESSLQSTFASQFTALSAYSSQSSLSSSSSSCSSSSSPPHSSIASSPSDPFLGVPFSNDGSISPKYGMMDMDEHGIETHYDYSYSFGMGDDGFGVLPPSSVSGMGIGAGAGVGKGEKKRVRIALKSLPAAGGEGGEWEVQIC